MSTKKRSPLRHHSIVSAPKRATVSHTRGTQREEMSLRVEEGNHVRVSCLRAEKQRHWWGPRRGLSLDVRANGKSSQARKPNKIQRPEHE